MANIASARKRARQTEVRRRLKASQRSLLRTYIRRVVAQIDSGDKEAAGRALAAATPIIDRMVTKGLIHKNKAARHKSHLNARIKAL